MISVFDLVETENIVARGENSGFSPCPTMFSKVFFLKVDETQDCEVKGLIILHFLEK